MINHCWFRCLPLSPSTFFKEFRLVGCSIIASETKLRLANSILRDIRGSCFVEVRGRREVQESDVSRERPVKISDIKGWPVIGTGSERFLLRTLLQATDSVIV